MKSPSLFNWRSPGAFTGMYGTFPIVVIEIVTPLNDRVVRTEESRYALPSSFVIRADRDLFLVVDSDTER